MNDAASFVGEVKATHGGELVAVFEGDHSNRIHWFQNSGVIRRLVGVQVFLDRRFRTHCVAGPETALGSAKVPPPDMR